VVSACYSCSCSQLGEASDLFSLSFVSLILSLKVIVLLDDVDFLMRERGFRLAAFRCSGCAGVSNDTCKFCHVILVFKRL
jgi:hypothetical protein